MNVADILGSVATALSVGFAWPQVVRVHRARTVEGISPRGTLHGVAGSASWASYGVITGVAPLVVANSLVCLAMVLVGVAQCRARVLRAPAIALAAACASGITFLAATASTPLAGWFAIVVGATSFAPQALHVIRSTDLSGVSVMMYGMLVATGTTWSIYGFLIGDPLLAAPNGIVLPCALVVLVRTLRFRRGSPSGDEPGGDTDPLPALVAP